MGDDPVPVADALERVRAQLGLPAATRLAMLEAAWPEIVGEHIAAHASLTGIRDGALVVTVDAPPWATELRYLEAQVLDRVRVHLGTDEIRALRVRVRPESAR